MKVTSVTPPNPAPLVPTTPKSPCDVVEVGDSLLITFTIEPTVAHKLKKRAGIMPMDRYLWENILNRSIVDSVY
jgi:hypothetical protein